MIRHRVASKSEVPEGAAKIVEVNGISFGLFQVKGQYYAWRNVCPHAGAPVCEGKVCGTRLPTLVYEYRYGRDNEILRCPWHGWEFDLLTGEHLVDPATRLRRGQLEAGSCLAENLEPGELHSEEEDLYLIMRKA